MSERKRIINYNKTIDDKKIDDELIDDKKINRHKFKSIIKKYKQKLIIENPNNLILYPYNNIKILESKYMEKFYKTNRNIKIIQINYDNININQQIINSYLEKPDVLIIRFNSDSSILRLTSIPKYPIFINNIFYISPICIEQVNGFINDNSNISYIINNFINRIIKTLGGIISDTNFRYTKMENLNLNSGIKSLKYTDFKQNWNVNNIPQWMTKNIPINNAGWFSIYNKIAIDYIHENYPNFRNVAELGAYFGLSTKYIAERFSNVYSFDFFDNYMLANYTLKNITPLEIKYYFKYIKFESFHAKLSEFPNLFTVKLDCFESVNFLIQNNIHVDIFYIDFVKKDNLLINFVNKIFQSFPNCIIIGDDAVHLNESLKYFEENYNYVYMYTCYICSKNTELVNLDNLNINIRNEKHKQDTQNISELLEYNIDYQINYIIKLIKEYRPSNIIIQYMSQFNINPNTPCIFIEQNGNIFHSIGYNYNNNIKYYKKLYDDINRYIIDENKLNNMNLTPKEYIYYGKDKSFIFL